MKLLNQYNTYREWCVSHQFRVMSMDSFVHFMVFFKWLRKQKKIKPGYEIKTTTGPAREEESVKIASFCVNDNTAIKKAKSWAEHHMIPSYTDNKLKEHLYSVDIYENLEERHYNEQGEACCWKSPFMEALIKEAMEDPDVVYIRFM